MTQIPPTAIKVRLAEKMVVSAHFLSINNRPFSRTVANQACSRTTGCLGKQVSSSVTRRRANQCWTKKQKSLHLRGLSRPKGRGFDSRHLHQYIFI